MSVTTSTGAPAYRAHRLCAWSGAVIVPLFFLGFGVLARFIPPPSPRESPTEIARLFAADPTQLRLGLIITMFACGLMGVFFAEISGQLKRMEGTHPCLTYVQLACGTVLVVEFILPLFCWLTAAYRPGTRNPEIIQTLNDLAWLPFVGATSSVFFQFLAIGVATLQQRNSVLVIPRWAGYFNIWMAFMVTPGTLCVFVTDGPFAWDGLLSFWIPLSSFTLWLVTMTVLLVRATAAAQLEPGQLPADSGGPSRAEFDRLVALVHQQQERSRP
jgi:hypothetical protein